MSTSDSTKPSAVQSEPRDHEQLGPGFEITAPHTGRFANALQKTTLAVRGLQVLRSDLTSSFILNLEPDGSATLCRGWRYLSFSDGPQNHREERIREQLGYRGHWQASGAWLELELARDEGVCPFVGEYSHLVPRHADRWQLRCLPVASSESSPGDMTFLACPLPGVQPELGETDPHWVPGVLPSGTWLLLGSGNGVRVRLEHETKTGHEAPALEWYRSPDEITSRTWEHSF